MLIWEKQNLAERIGGKVTECDGSFKLDLEFRN